MMIMMMWIGYRFKMMTMIWAYFGSIFERIILEGTYDYKVGDQGDDDSDRADTDANLDNCDGASLELYHKIAHEYSGITTNGSNRGYCGIQDISGTKISEGHTQVSQDIIETVAGSKGNDGADMLRDDYCTLVWDDRGEDGCGDSKEGEDNNSNTREAKHAVVGVRARKL